MSGIEGMAARAGGSIATFLGKRLWRRMRLQALREWSTPAIPAAVARATIDELSPEETRALASYLDSPDFEQLALQLVLLDKHSADIAAMVREELRHGLRHATALPADRLVAVTDLVFDALLIASRADQLRLEPMDVAAKAHLAAAAARNGELLARVWSLNAFREQGEKLRAQVRAIHAQLRVPYTRASRTVPWDRLYVEPSIFRFESKHSVILGDPGAGKSTFATKLAYDVAATDVVPFLVVLRDLPRQALERRFAEHLVTVAASPYNVEMAAEAVEYLLLNGRAMVICDGLDELMDVSMRRRVVDLIDGFASLFPTTPVVVTSRKVGYAEVPLNAMLFDVTTIQPFDTDRVRQYAANWFALDGYAPGMQESFLAESESIKDLRSNPLLLSLLCGMYSSEQYIPRNRTEVYRKCAEMLFDHWDSMRGIKMPVAFQGFVRGAIEELAWHMLAVAEDVELPHREVMSVLIGYLREQGFGEHDASREAGEFLSFCAGRAWVLAEVGATETEPIYGFAHRTFMEFFAAERIVRNHASAEHIVAVLRPRIVAGAWEEVAQLAVQIFDRARNGGGQRILELMLAENDADLVGFAARAAGHLTFSPALCERVVAAALDFRQQVALRTLAHEGLQTNRRYVDRALFEQLTRLADAGDKWAKVVLLDEPQRVIPDVGELCRAFVQRQTVWLPAVFDVPDGRLREVSEWLMRRPTPWLQEWSIKPAVFPRSTHAVVLLLPFLEHAARLWWSCPEHFEPLVLARRNRERIRGVELPDYCRDFVERWARLEFSVVA